MSRKNKRSQINREFYEPALEGFAGQYDIELQIFGPLKYHWRLSSTAATLDCWTTTGKYWLKDVPSNGFMSNHFRSGELPHDYGELDTFLCELFGIAGSI